MSVSDRWGGFDKDPIGGPPRWLVVALVILLLAWILLLAFG